MLGSNPSADSVAKTEVGRLICAPLPSLSQPLGIGTKATNPGVAGAKPPLLHPLQTLNSHYKKHCPLANSVTFTYAFRQFPFEKPSGRFVPNR